MNRREYNEPAVRGLLYMEVWQDANGISELNTLPGIFLIREAL